MRVDRCYECGHRSVDWQWWKLRHFLKYKILRRKRPVWDEQTRVLYETLVEVYGEPIFSREVPDDPAPPTTVRWDQIVTPNWVVDTDEDVLI